MIKFLTSLFKCKCHQELEQYKQDRADAIIRLGNAEARLERALIEKAELAAKLHNNEIQARNRILELQKIIKEQREYMNKGKSSRRLKNLLQKY